MSTRTKSTPVVDAEIVDQSGAVAVASDRFDRDFSSLVPRIHELTPDDLEGIPGLRIEGATVVQKGWLLGVPFTVTSATFWTPAAEKNPWGLRMGMVACEATIANADRLGRQIARKRVLELNGDDSRVVGDLDELAFYPGERVVFNDESTGIRRQIVAWLVAHEMIKLPASHAKYEGHPHDMPWPLWESFIESTTQGEGVLVPRFTRFPSGNPFIIHCDRGLRVSEYTNSYTGTEVGRTFYFG